MSEEPLYTVYVYITGGIRGGILRGLHSPRERIPLVSEKIAKFQIPFLGCKAGAHPNARQPYRGTSLIKKLPPSWDPDKVLGIGLLYGGGSF